MEARLKTQPIKIAGSLQTTEPEHHPTTSNPSSMTRTILSDPRLEKWNRQDRLKTGIGAWETVGNHHSHRTATVLPRRSLLGSKKMRRHKVAVAESIQAVEQSSAVPQPLALLKKTKKEPADQARDIHEYIALLPMGTNKGRYEGFVDMGRFRRT